MNRTLHYIAFFLGLAAIAWVGVGYAGINALAFAITLAIGGFYLMGAIELHRFDRATATLSDAVDSLQATPATLGEWLGPVHPSLQNAVRLRVEGERVGLPGPAMTPYLAGLLVLLGMLGTFLGMVVTLNGTGIALESASDVLAIRSSLAAPVRGLGLAFGTSLAGVAASAMLGLVSALCRRDRLQTAQRLDMRIATTLRPFSLAHRRDESFRLMQRQAEAMPELADRLQAMMTTIERQGEALNQRLVASQDGFHGKAETVYAGLAASVDRALRDSLTESARIAGATIQPVVEATMAGIARETAALQGTVAQALQTQLEGLSMRFETTTGRVGAIWETALVEHRRSGEALSAGLGASLDRFAGTFEQRSASLVDGISARLETTVGQLSDGWRTALARHGEVSEKLAGDTHRALAETAAGFARHAAALHETVGKAHADLQTGIDARDRQRLAAWNDSLGAMAVALKDEWQQAGADTAQRQQEICRTLAGTAQEIAAHSEAQARSTIAEIGRLVDAAAEAPRAAAEVIAELRRKLSDSLVRDNAMLDERARILGTLDVLLGAVNHASTEQRTAIDALVATSAGLLERVGAQFAGTVDAGTGRLAAVGAQLAGSAVEVASLGESFGLAVQRFGESNDRLGAQLQRIETALGKSMVRSDEQLAYYVAQAREVVDLSILSQKQIVEELQHLAARRSAVGSEA